MHCVVFYKEHILSLSGGDVKTALRKMLQDEQKAAPSNCSYKPGAVSEHRDFWELHQTREQKRNSVGCWVSCTRVIYLQLVTCVHRHGAETVVCAQPYSGVS